MHPVMTPLNPEQLLNNEQKALRIVVFGGGSVGLGLASCLVKSGCRVQIIARPETCSLLRKEGLLRTGIFGEYHADPQIFEVTDSAAGLSPDDYDYILVCVKSFDTKAAAQQLATSGLLALKGPAVVLCQNGYGNYEIFAEHLPEEQLFLGRVITGFRRLKENHVDITVHAAPIHFGSLSPGRSVMLGNLATAVTNGGIPAEVTREIAKDLWAKVLYNALLNPLGAVFSVPYGALGDCEHSRILMEKIAQEAYAVMAAAEITTHWPTVEDFLSAFYHSMLLPTADHESSMLQDIRSGRRTEIDALNGAIARLGKKYELPVPVNETITALVKFLEIRK